VGTKNFKHVYEDALFLVIFAVLIIIIAAIVEVYVFPIF
jgi:hypothetical protein